MCVRAMTALFRGGTSCCPLVRDCSSQPLAKGWPPTFSLLRQVGDPAGSGGWWWFYYLLWLAQSTYKQELVLPFFDSPASWLTDFFTMQTKSSLECWCRCHANSCGASRGTPSTIQVYFLWGWALGQPQSEKWWQRPAHTSHGQGAVFPQSHLNFRWQATASLLEYQEPCLPLNRHGDGWRMGTGSREQGS